MAFELRRSAMAAGHGFRWCRRGVNTGASGSCSCRREPHSWRFCAEYVHDIRPGSGLTSPQATTPPAAPIDNISLMALAESRSLGCPS
jgi:hypothetical protein